MSKRRDLILPIFALCFSLFSLCVGIRTRAQYKPSPVSMEPAPLTLERMRELDIFLWQHYDLGQCLPDIFWPSVFKETP